MCIEMDKNVFGTQKIAHHQELFGSPYGCT